MTVAERTDARVLGHPAPLGSRLAAYLLDWLVTFILTCVCLSAGGLIVLVTSDMGRQDPPDRAILIAVIIASLVIPAWLILTLAGWTVRGRSIGKLAMNLRIVGPSGAAPGIGRSLVRVVVYVMENLPLAALAPAVAAGWLLRLQGIVGPVLAGYAATLLLPVVSVAMMLWSRSRRALHDRVAGTMVIAE